MTEQLQEVEEQLQQILERQQQLLARQRRLERAVAAEKEEENEGDFDKTGVT